MSGLRRQKMNSSLQEGTMIGKKRIDETNKAVMGQDGGTGRECAGLLQQEMQFNCDE